MFFRSGNHPHTVYSNTDGYAIGSNLGFSNLPKNMLTEGVGNQTTDPAQVGGKTCELSNLEARMITMYFIQNIKKKRRLFWENIYI